MARDVYSLRIFASASLTAASGLVGPIVPAGLVYVLRDIDVTCLTNAAGDNFIVQSQVLGQLWGVFITSPVSNIQFAWRGRQVYNEGERVGFEVGHGTWSIAASGYQLTLP